MLFNLFKKKEVVSQIDYSSIKVDLHSHLIPGIDDGAQTLEDSIELIKRIAELGYKKIITTPHVMADFYRNGPDTILPGLELIKQELKAQNIDIQIEAAAEYYLDESFERKLESEKMLTLGGKYLLFELSFINYPQNLLEVIAKIHDAGYTPLMAHPERYPFLIGSMDNYSRIKDAGCYLQLNTISLTGYYGKPAQTAAEQMIDNYLIDFIGSDMHHIRHAAALKSALKTPYLYRLLTDYQLQNELLF
ncbi:MAG: capsular biosynthesis protein [Sphingobacteriaceae bacterium]|jgi:tyrosine-protein phosphatase YwqE|nr:capsular biosynthesis protein [Sphingobacteriaceae bacterium]